MNRLSKTLLIGLACAVCFGAATIGLTSVVEYFPYGVPEHRRQEYDDKIAELSRLNAISKSTTKRPRAIFKKLSHDFGLLSPHETASYSFKVTNQGEAPLHLEVLDSTCKCTVGNLKTPLLAAGESTYVKLTWNTGYQNEEYQQSVTIKTNDARRETITLTVKGEVRAELVIPESIVFDKCDAGEHAKAEFVVYSQLWNDFSITDLKSELRDFNWDVEPIDPSAPELGDIEAKTAYKVNVFSYRQERGKFEGDFSITVEPPGGEAPQTREVKASGYVRSAIGFYSPLIHKTEGLDIGTILKGKRHEVHLTVRSRGKERRELAILDAEPKKGIQYELKLNPDNESYRLSIIIPEDCPRILFNGDHKHGFVQVGDPNDEAFSNWFPLLGAVVDVAE